MQVKAKADFIHTIQHKVWWIRKAQALSTRQAQSDITQVRFKLNRNTSHIRVSSIPNSKHSTEIIQQWRQPRQIMRSIIRLSSSHTNHRCMECITVIKIAPWSKIKSYFEVPHRKTIMKNIEPTKNKNKKIRWLPNEFKRFWTLT